MTYDDGPLTPETDAFRDDVSLDRLRAIQAAGGLAKLLEAFDGLYAACWHGGFARCNAACKAAEPFRVKEDAT